MNKTTLPQARPRKNPPQRPQRTLIPQQKHPQSSINGNLIFMGTYEGGKSTTINTLLGQREVSPVEGKEGGTTSILEFMTHYPDGRNLRIIDTPGLGAANNLQWDSQVLATMKKYFDTDHELKSRIPHVVVIVARYDDSKLRNPNSSFIKCLKGINLLNRRLFDRNSCNVIILLTRFMNAKKSEKLNTQEKYNTIIDIVRQYTDFPQMPYILLGENEADYWDLAVTNEKTIEGYNFGDSIQLPNNEGRYPTNLIELIIKISCGSAKGAVGPDFFRNVFQTRDKVFIWQSCSLPILPLERSRCQQAYVILQERYHPNFCK